MSTWRITGAAAVALAASCAFAPAAGAATRVGETFTPPSGFCDPFFTHLAATSPAGSYTIPSAGVITSWSYQADATPPQVRFKVFRRVAGNTFAVTRQGDLESPAPGALHSSDTRASVEAGDVIGLYTTNAECGRSAAGYEIFYDPGDFPTGTVRAYSGPASFQLNISAVLEPDCDKDGYGDESQDQDLRACPPGPAATILSAPPDKVKTKKNRATATFIFTADDPDAAFNCTLDGKQELEPCVSPLTVTVRRGEHTFSVQATDAGGNAGAAATDTFKVKRKKKKR